MPTICPYYMRFMRGIDCCSFRASYLSLLYEVYGRCGLWQYPCLLFVPTIWGLWEVWTVVVSMPAICPYYMTLMRGIDCCSFCASYLSLLYEVYGRCGLWQFPCLLFVPTIWSTVPTIWPYYMRFMGGVNCGSFLANYLSLLYEVHGRYGLL
jgi:hypothetical protein